MYIKMMVSECDYTDRKYEAPVEGAGILVRGASGRWCIVMWVGPEYLKETNTNVILPEEALREIRKIYPNAHVEFD